MMGLGATGNLGNIVILENINLYKCTILECEQCNLGK